MIELLNKTAGKIFYIMGVLYFLFYLLYYNDILAVWMEWIMELFDLSLILAAMTYGGTSFLKSITNPDNPSKIAIALTVTPLGLLFAGFVVLNFWDAFGFGL